MPDLLLELLSEEIPARMQRRAAEDLKSLVTNALVDRGLVYEGAKAFATPRRLALTIVGLPVKGRDSREEKKGPRVGAPDAALQGFLKAAGLADLSQARIERDQKKGEFYVAVIEKPGLPAAQTIAAILPDIIRQFPWPKSMRWGEASAPPGSPFSTADAKGAESLRWVRPLQSILCLFGPETEEPEVIHFSVDGIHSGDLTRGHRFLSPAPIRVRRFEDYAAKLERGFVVLDADRRKDIIAADARNLALAQNFELVEDDALLEEVAGLVEWPVPLMGAFERRFLEIPAEVIRATIRANQKSFVMRRPDGSLANRFLLTANMQAQDGGATIIAGNERVIRARLSDAFYFWKTDQAPLPDYVNDLNCAKPLDQRLAKLRALNIVFHEKLGTQGQRIDRLAALARELAARIGADPQQAARAAELSKADLVTEMVGEFPETQGLMGRRYAELQGEEPSVARAIEEHYKPQGPADRTPGDKISIAVGLADKIDMLVGFWAIDEKPTGSKDPYALRRAALGVIRLIVENGVRIGLTNALMDAFNNLRSQNPRIASSVHEKAAGATDVTAQIGRDLFQSDLLAFFHERLKVLLREKGARHDLVDAVLALDGDNDDLLLIVRRVEALSEFLAAEDGASLLIGLRRAANILRAEEKKEGESAFDGAPDSGLLVAEEELTLHSSLAMALPEVAAASAREDFQGAMRALSRLRAPVDSFFDKVTVNAGETDLRRNRLRLLNQFRAATRAVANFEKIAG